MSPVVLPTPRVWPVVHHQVSELTLAQASLALDAGAHGVFLIAHNAPDDDLVPLVHFLMRRYPAKDIGVNFLGCSAPAAAHRCVQEGFNILWVDNAGATGRGLTEEGQELADISREANLTVFAGVAFKYQAPEPAPDLAAAHALAQGWIPTTSGVGTGHAADLGKLQRMREALNRGHAIAPRLALASGLTPENVADYLATTTDLLVATGISRDVHHFDPERLADFLARANTAG